MVADTIQKCKDAHPKEERKQDGKRAPSAPSSQIFLAATSLLKTSRKAAVPGIAKNSRKKGRVSHWKGRMSHTSGLWGFAFPLNTHHAGLTLAK